VCAYLPSLSFSSPAVWFPMLLWQKLIQSRSHGEVTSATRLPTWPAHSSAPLTTHHPSPSPTHTCLWIHHWYSPPPTPWTALPTRLKHHFLAVCLTQSVTLTTSTESAGAVDVIWKGCGRWISDAIMASAWQDWKKTTNCFSPDGRSWGPNRTPPDYQARGTNFITC
jgi:hypothetical protein